MKSDMEGTNRREGLWEALLRSTSGSQRIPRPILGPTGPTSADTPSVYGMATHAARRPQYLLERTS